MSVRMNLTPPVSTATARPVAGVFRAPGLGAQKPRMLDAAITALLTRKHQFLGDRFQNPHDGIPEPAFVQPRTDRLVLRGKRGVVPEKGIMHPAAELKKHLLPIG